MAAISLTSPGPWSLRITTPIYRQIMAHLSPGDGDEHGGVLTAGICTTARGTRLLVREFIPAQDCLDYVPGTRGYRALTPHFVAEVAGRCADEDLCYLAIHNHGGRGRVAFSSDDMASHERGYPALLDITGGGPVGALVFAEDAVAGDIWTSDNDRHAIERTIVVGPHLKHLFPSPPPLSPATDPIYDRHARMFGDLGQQRLKELKVGIIGAGGGGSLLSQMLAHLGVGHLVVIDHDRVDLTNLPRIVGATRWDARSVLTARQFAPLQRLGKRLATYKVRVAERVARRAQPAVRFDAVIGNIVDSATAALVCDVDVLFLATDTMQSRLVFNSIVHQYLIPGFQIGAKVQIDSSTRHIESAFAVTRPVLPYHQGGCLLCNGLIPPDRLQQEALSSDERAAQRYVDDEDVHEPSVITLNAISAAQAADDLLMMVTELFEPEIDLGSLMHQAREHTTYSIDPRTSPVCLDCGVTSRSRLARGNRRDLPCRTTVI